MGPSLISIQISLRDIKMLFYLQLLLEVDDCESSESSRFRFKFDFIIVYLFCFNFPFTIPFFILFVEFVFRGPFESTLCLGI